MPGKQPCGRILRGRMEAIPGTGCRDGGLMGTKTSPYLLFQAGHLVSRIAYLNMLGVTSSCDKATAMTVNLRTSILCPAALSTGIQLQPRCPSCGYTP